MEIIKYECPECNQVSGADEWNESTRGHYGNGIEEIDCGDRDESYYICPKCSEESDGDKIKVRIIK